jgi:membrane protein YdbS with pleckstrin-like domain
MSRTDASGGGTVGDGTDGVAPSTEAVRDVDAWMARGEDETVRWAGRPRTTTILPWVAAGLAIAAVPAVLAVAADEPLLAVLAPLGLALPAWAYLRVANTRFVVTDVALYRKTGIISRRVQRVAVDRVQNSAFDQGVTGSLFGYGNVHVEAAGGGTIRFDAIDDPRAVRRFVDRQTSGTDVPGSLEQWQAVRDEVQAVRAALERR